MTVTMYDGINTDAAAIKRVIKPGDKVAYYIDGRFAWTQAQIDMFPDNEHVTITVLGNPADVADCETGDLSPASAAAWVRRMRSHGYLRPTIYNSLYAMQSVRLATAELVLGKDWDSWLADYDNLPTSVYPGIAAKQYRSELDMDVSTVYFDGWPFRKATPSPAPTPRPTPTPAPVALPKWPAGLTLRLGNVGHAVEAMQTALRNSGIYGVRGIGVDGQFGPQTLTAVRNFQLADHVVVDGIAGVQVRSELIRLGKLSYDGSAAA